MASDAKERILQQQGSFNPCPPQLLESGDILRTPGDDHTLASDVSSEYS